MGLGSIRKWGLNFKRSYCEPCRATKPKLASVALQVEPPWLTLIRNYGVQQFLLPLVHNFELLIAHFMCAPGQSKLKVLYKKTRKIVLEIPHKVQIARLAS